MIYTLVISILAIHVVAMMMPGPTFVVAARIAAVEGFRTALGFAFGVASGSVIWALAAMFGLTILFELLPALLGVMKVLGGIFLLWIAYSLWKKADEPMPNADNIIAPRSTVASMRLGLMTQLANPKTAVYFGAVFAGLVPQGTDWHVLAFVLLGVLIVETLWFSAVARIFSLNASRHVYTKIKKWIDRSFGGLIAIFGLKIASS